MSATKISMKDAVLAAVQRISKQKCSEEFNTKDLEGEIATIVRVTGSKAKTPKNSVSLQLQKLRDEGKIKFLSVGKYSIVGGVAAKKKTSAAKRKTAPAKKKKTAAAKKKTSAAKRKTAVAKKKVSAAKRKTTAAKKKKASAAKKKKVSVAKKRKQVGGKRKRAPKRTRALNFSTYSYKVMKTIVPKKVGISRKGMKVIDSLVFDVLYRLGTTALEFSKSVGRKTLRAQDVRGATHVLFPGELGQHAISEGLKAENNFDVQRKKGPKTARAGLVFSVPRVARYFRSVMPHTNISSNAPVFAAAVVEYLLSEVFELSSNAARDNKRSRIIPRHIALAILNDAELAKLFRGVTFAYGGVLPNIHSVLLPPKKKQRS